MKIFLSYASEDEGVAADVAKSIAARGHTVFFDQKSLPAGNTYEDKIEKAVSKCDLFVFLISPYSVAPGKYTHTEVGLAERRWRQPAKRVLPVEIARTDPKQIPAYLRSVTILKPKGNIAAETAAQVDKMRPAVWQRVAAGAAIALLAGSGAWFGLPYIRPAPDVRVVAQEPLPWERGHFGFANTYNLIFAAENKGDIPGRLTDKRLVTTPADTLTITGGGPDYSAEAPTSVPPVGETKNHFLVTPKPGMVAGTKWRICVTEATQGQICTPDHDWSPVGDFSPATAFSLSPELSRGAVAVARYKDGFALASRSPNALYLIGADGAVLTSRALEGEPTALYAENGMILVGTRGPNALLRLDGDDLAVKVMLPIAFPREIHGTFDDPVSSTPVQIGRAKDRVWVLTRGGAAASGLLHVSTDLKDPRVPPYFGNVAFDLRSMNLSSNGEQVWGVETATTPASLHRFSPQEMIVYSGHKFDIASCASDVLIRGQDLLVPDCDGKVQRVVPSKSDLQIAGQVGSLSGYRMDAQTWTVVNFRRTPDTTGTFLVKSTRLPGADQKDSVVARVNPKKGLALLLDLKGIEVIDTAFQDNVFLTIIQGADGSRETLALRYE